ncbi:MAG: hypothetical protein JST82_16645 [Bacteroidetes bacterium]|nr:hypothetical protein [Bacteroidota bacterium]
MKKLVVIACILGLSCNSNHDANNHGIKMNEISWLIGGWQMNMPDGKIIESWQQVNDTFFIGTSSFINITGDTEEHESIRLLLQNDTLYYMPTVSNQNKSKEIVFKMNPNSKELLFENPEHDFPKYILYKKQSDSTIYACVSDGLTNSSKKLEFNYQRIK